MDAISQTHQALSASRFLHRISITWNAFLHFSQPIPPHSPSLSLNGLLPEELLCSPLLKAWIWDLLCAPIALITPHPSALTDTSYKCFSLPLNSN